MKFIEIISDILLYGGGLLFLVVWISFLLSKKKVKEKRSAVKTVRSTIVPKIVLNDNGGEEQLYLRKNQSTSYPQIYNIESSRQREIKVVRKASAFARDGQIDYRQDSNSQMKADGIGTRYTIINEELNKSSHSAANFYF